jgi:hypothetical protein
MTKEPDTYIEDSDCCDWPRRARKAEAMIDALTDQRNELADVRDGQIEEIDALTQKVAELEGCLSGDPHLTATKEEREHWRHCAILYSNKLEQKVKDLEAEIKKKDEELMVRDKALELMAGHTIKVDWYLKQAKKLLIKKDASKKPDDKCSKCANNGIECLTCWAIIGEDADDNFKPKRKGIGKK